MWWNRSIHLVTNDEMNVQNLCEFFITWVHSNSIPHITSRAHENEKITRKSAQHTWGTQKTKATNLAKTHAHTQLTAVQIEIHAQQQEYGKKSVQSKHTFQTIILHEYTLCCNETIQSLDCARSALLCTCVLSGEKID